VHSVVMMGLGSSQKENIINIHHAVKIREKNSELKLMHLDVKEKQKNFHITVKNINNIPTRH
jgi:hypothetical protein